MQKEASYCIRFSILTHPESFMTIFINQKLSQYQTASAGIPYLHRYS